MRRFLGTLVAFLSFPTNVILHAGSYLILPPTKYLLKRAKPHPAIRILGAKWMRLSSVLTFAILLIVLAIVWPRTFPAKLIARDPNWNPAMGDYWLFREGGMLTLYLILVIILLIQLLLYMRLDLIKIRLSSLCLVEKPRDMFFDDKFEFVNKATEFACFMEVHQLDTPSPNFFDAEERRMLKEAYDYLRRAITMRQEAIAKEIEVGALNKPMLAPSSPN